MRKMSTACLAMIAVLVAVGLVGISPAMAEAPESEWTIGTETLTELELKEEEVSIAGTAVSLSLSSEDKLACEKTEGTGKIFQKGSDELHVSLTSCKLVGFPECKVTEPVKLDIEARRSYGFDYDTVGAIKGKSSLATVTLKGKCHSLPESSELTGSVAGLIPEKVGPKEPFTFSQEISEVTNEELEEGELEGLHLKFGKLSAYLNGTIEIQSSGGGSNLFLRDWVNTTLCKVQPNAQNRCPAGESYPEETVLTLEKEQTARFKLGIVTTDCTTSKMLGKTAVVASSPLEGVIDYDITNCNNGCTVTVEGKPYVFLLEAYAEPRFRGEGMVRLVHAELKFSCGGNGTCIYYSELNSGGNVKGGTPRAKLSAVVLMGKVTTGSSAGCENILAMETPTSVFGPEYKFETPMPMWVAVA